MTESEMKHDYWLEVPHLFHPAHWGPAYCALCLKKRRGEGVKHLDPSKLDPNDPRHIGPQTDRPVRKPAPAFWRPLGWSDDGGSCSYAGMQSLEEAAEECRRLMREGDDRGVVHDHYGVDEVIWRTVADVFHHPVEEEKP